MAAAGHRPALIQRAAIDVDTPHSRAVFSTEPPGREIKEIAFRDQKG
jgi:hypothetical protein